jgi:hypothetical protein
MYHPDNNAENNHKERVSKKGQTKESSNASCTDQLSV